MLGPSPLPTLELYSKSKFLRLWKHPKQNIQSTKHPLLLFHGAPESHLIWTPYLDRLGKDRDMYLLAFPSDQSDAPTPSALEMATGRLAHETRVILDAWADAHSTFVVGAHDFGAEMCSNGSLHRIDGVRYQQWDLSQWGQACATTYSNTG